MAKTKQKTNPYNYPTPEEQAANLAKLSDTELGKLLKTYYDARKRLNAAGICV